MAFTELVRTYLGELKDAASTAAASGEMTPELSYKPMLDRLFRRYCTTLDRSVAVIFEPRNQARAGRPDWRFHDQDTLGVYGYCEGKGLELTEHLSPEPYQDQLAKYQTLRHRLILTDGLDFWFIAPDGEVVRSVSLVEKPVDLSALTRIPVDRTLDVLLREFFSEPGFRRCTDDRLVEEAARRASALSESVCELVQQELGSGLFPAENRTIEALHKLQAVLTEHHDASLATPKGFSDFVAQVLIFGLLYAQRVVSRPGDNPRDRYENIHNFWSDVVYSNYSERLRPFQGLVEELSDELERNSLGPLGTWYEDCRLMLAYVDLLQSQRAEPDYHALYESFLKVFDPQTRFNYGVFYTPRPLASYAVRLAGAVAEHYFHGASIYDEGNRIIDPCCGTGTFLDELLRDKNEDEMRASIAGLEILPGPYALAHYRLTMLRNPAYPTRVRILLTDTLADCLDMAGGDAQNIFEEELNEARCAVRRPLTLVIGNPPSSDSLMNREVPNQERILALLEDWRPPQEERASRQNIQKQIKNEFMKFFRWACDRLEDDCPGIVAFVVPASFASKTSYKFARLWLLTYFDSIWVLDLDKDGRRGIETNSLFNTRQGRLLFVGYRRGDAREGVGEVFYSSINALSRTEKLEFLRRRRGVGEMLSEFEPLAVETEGGSLRPHPILDNALLEHCVPLASSRASDTFVIIARHCSGIKLAPTSFFTHVNRDVLMRKIRAVANRALPFSDLRERWFSGQRRPPREAKRSPELQQALSDSFRGECIKRYTYRPFVTTYVYLDEESLRVLQRSGGGGTRLRPEILSAFACSQTFGIAITPAPEDVSDRLHRLACFCWHLPDNDLSMRGNARLLCNRFPEYASRSQRWDPRPLCNLAEGIEGPLCEMLHSSQQAALDTLIFYTYAVLSSNVYLSAFEDSLFSVSPDVWPRIPVTRDAALFRRLAESGQCLAELENPDHAIDIGEQYKALLDGWTGDFRLGRYPIDPDAETITLSSASARDVRCVVPCPKEVLHFRACGYSPISEWLKIHSEAYSRMHFTADYLMEFVSLIERVHRHLEIVEDEIDPMVQEIIAQPGDLIRAS